MRKFSYLISNFSRLNIKDKKIIKHVNLKKVFDNELNALLRLDHKYIIKYNIVNIESGIFEFPYYENGDLISYLIHKSRTIGIKDTFTDYIREIKPVCKKISLAIEHCHSNNVIHCDIKPDNIVLDNSFNPILIDFGNAFLTDIDRFDGSTLGTYGYSAPELPNGKIGSYTDIYSLGCLFNTIFYHNLPFFLANGEINYKEYKNSNQQVPENIRDLIINMLDPVYEKRPTIKDILQTSFMEEIILEE